ncbi:unnamed protein product [Mytilus coruscus]|uniref:B box-type domain-containing protein n=1 Tax=Mytilus coruscus TaxID=42192 RepID=A0A6J8CD79_MYTCO|nr:unnamed protein product [Mytilus coruscus]
MLDKRALEKAEKMCNSCQLNKESTKAKSWCTICEEAFCEQCEKCHKTFKMSARHKLLNIREMQSGGTPSKYVRYKAVKSIQGRSSNFIVWIILSLVARRALHCHTVNMKMSLQYKKPHPVSNSQRKRGISQRLREHVILFGEVIDERNTNLADV